MIPNPWIILLVINYVFLQNMQQKIVLNSLREHISIGINIAYKI
jgi:hypothetical protein